MTSNFKKFVLIIASLIFSWLTILVLGWFVYLKPGDSFVSPAILFVPVGIICIFLYYFQLKRIFGVNADPNVKPQSQRKVVLFSLLFISIVVLVYFGLRVLENRQNTLAEQAIQNKYKEREVFLKEHCTIIDKNSRTPVYRCDDGTTR